VVMVFAFPTPPTRRVADPTDQGKHASLLSTCGLRPAPLRHGRAVMLYAAAAGHAASHMQKAMDPQQAVRRGTGWKATSVALNSMVGLPSKDGLPHVAICAHHGLAHIVRGCVVIWSLLSG
jgi:hypothetical protein